MRDFEAIVVGSGIFGNTIARALQSEGREVLVLDSQQPYSGSGPSGCLMKPSWFSGLGRDVYQPSLELIDLLFGIHDLEFRLRPIGRRVTVHWANATDTSGLKHLVDATVTSVKPGVVEYHCRTESGNVLHGDVRAPLIVVAAGIWCTRLLEVPDLVGKQGASFTWPMHRVDEFENFISPWAPYKQVVAFEMPTAERRIWCGDGTAIMPKHWTTERLAASAVRCSRAVKRERSFSSCQVGIRPFSKVKPCLLEEREPGLWLATGGAKNGTIAAGWAAHRIVEATS